MAQEPGNSTGLLDPAEMLAVFDPQVPLDQQVIAAGEISASRVGALTIDDAWPAMESRA